MGGPGFRIWFGTRAASIAELERIEEIEVVQEVDAFWEARLRIALCLDANGAWLHWPGDRTEPFSRIRVEVDIGTGAFTPLIDGPLVSIDAELDSRPGRSSTTMVVRDDSVFLDRDGAAEPPFEHRRASEIAETLFGRFGQIRDTRIQATDDAPETTTRRGTVLQFLRRLGRGNDRHVYVLPGDRAGESVGCFLPDPVDPATLPPLVLNGEGSNLAGVTISQDPAGGERTAAYRVRIDDHGVTRFETMVNDSSPLRDLPAVPADLAPRGLLHPTDNVREDPATGARAQARRDALVYRLTGALVPGCYGALLSPYRKVRVDAGATPYSGDYLITKVTHRITPSLHHQELEARSDSLTRVSATQTAEAGGALTAAASAAAVF